MKLTAAAGECYWRNFYSVSPEIWIDGVQLHSVIEADDVAGYAIQTKYDANFRPVRGDGKFVTVRREGKVSFVGGHRRSEQPGQQA